MPGCFGGKQLVKNNCVKFVPTARFLIQLTLTPSTHTNPNLLLTMEPGSKSYFHTNVCDDSFNITFGGNCK